MSLNAIWFNMLIIKFTLWLIFLLIFNFIMTLIRTNLSRLTTVEFALLLYNLALWGFVLFCVFVVINVV